MNKLEKLTDIEKERVFRDVKLKFEGSNFRITKQKNEKKGSSRTKFKKR